jgi:GAF domain-containing protein
VADVSTAVAGTSDSHQLLQIAVDQTKSSFNLYHAHIYLVDEQEEALVLAAGAGDVGRRMVAQGRRISLAREQSLVSQAAHSRFGVIVNDVKAEAGFLPHPLLPDTASEMAVPLIAGDQLLGVLDVQSDQVDRFTGEDVNIHATLAAQIAVALQNASRHEQTQAALDELSALQRTITREGWQAFMTADERPFKGFVASQETVKPVPRDKSASNGHGATGEDENFLEAPNMFDNPAVVAPLAVRGETVGGLGVRTTTEQPLSSEDQDLLESISHQVAQALERARLAEQTGEALSATEEHARRLAMLNRMSEQLNRAPTFEKLFDIAVEQIANILAADRAALTMITPSGDMVALRAIYGEAGDSSVGDLIPIEPESSLARAVRGERIVVMSTDSVGDTGAIRASVMAPLFGEKNVIGTINIGSKRSHAFSKSDNNLIVQIAAILGATIERRLLTEQAESRAERERILQEITARVSGSADVDTVMRTAVEEIGRALGRRAFVYLDDRKIVSQPSGTENGT